MYTNKIISGIGKIGEDYVANYLREKDYIVIKQNFSNKYGEIDIIAENDDYILFVEVKTRKDGALVSGLDAVDVNKRRRILNLANDFMSKFITRKNPRFDVAELTYSDLENPTFTINYIESAF